MLDLRDNGGGVVQAALQAASYFLKPGQRLLSVKGPQHQGPGRRRSCGRSRVPISARGAGEREDRQRIRNFGRSVAGSRSRDNLGRAQLRQRAGPKCIPIIWKHRHGAHHGVLLHAQRPIHSKAASPPASSKWRSRTEEFHTDSGRMVTGGGGIRPDVYVEPEPVTRLRMALDASGTFTSFATSYIQKHQITGKLRCFRRGSGRLPGLRLGTRNPAVGRGVGERTRLGAKPLEAGDFQSGAGRRERRRGGRAERSQWCKPQSRN